MIRSTIFLVVLLLFSCTKSGDNEDLSRNRAIWNKMNINNYEFTLRMNCYCPVEIAGPHVIKVVADTIESVNNLAYDPSTMGYLMTIDELFTFIETGVARNPYKKSLDFNSTYGYPQSVFFDFSKAIVDEEIGYQVSDFKVN
jgi:hypothetical protein